MSWAVYLKPSAKREMESLPDSMLARIDHVLCRLEDNPFPPRVKKLRNQNAYRIRVGDYRILYLVDSKLKEIEVIAIRHRKEAYR